MEVGNVFDTAVNAMQNDSSTVNDIAKKVASPQQFGGNISENVVDMMVAQRSFEANAVVIETADEMLTGILSI